MVSTGWPAVEDKCGELGVSFRAWQQGAGRLILAKRADGKYATTIGGTGLSIPRQTGKTFLVGAIVFALCLLRPGLTVIWTAHRLRTAAETFEKMKAFARRRRIAPHVDKVVLGSGDEAIVFRNGSRILFGARERGFGRGFDEVDVLIFDEAQILTDNALDDMIPAANQSRQDTGVLQLYMGTPPKPTDPSEVFTRMRSEALSGEDHDTAWVEFGADHGYEPTPAPEPLSKTDLAQVAKANPSYPQDTPLEAILRMRKKLGPASFLREGLGVWDEDSTKVEPALDVDLWRPLSLLTVPAEWQLAAIGVDMDPESGRLWVSTAAHAPAPGVHVELLPDDPMVGGLDAAVEWIAKGAKRRRPVVMRAESGATVLRAALVAKGCCKVYPLNGPEQAAATAGLVQAVKDGTVTHLDDPVLDLAVRESTKDFLRDGRMRFGSGDAPLWAATAAHMGAVKWARRRSGQVVH